MGKVIREICLQSLSFGGLSWFEDLLFTKCSSNLGQRKVISAFCVPWLSLHRSPTTDWMVVPKIVTLTYWPSRLRDYGFQSSDHLHIQQARLKWMRGVKAWMTSLSRRWKAVSGLTVTETNSTLETETQACYGKTVKLRGGAKLSIQNIVYATQ